MRRKRVLFVSRPGEQRTAYEKAAEIVRDPSSYEIVLYHKSGAFGTAGVEIEPALESLESMLASQVIDLLVIDGKLAYDLGLAREGETESRLSSSAQIALAPFYAPVPQPWDGNSNDYLDKTCADFAVNDTTAILPERLAEAITDVLQGKPSASYMFNRKKYETRVVSKDDKRPAT